MDVVQSIIIGIVEGITEFIPISSTGHMIIAEKLLGIPENEFTEMFTVAIQLGAILAVVVLYWKKFFDFKNLRFYFKLIIGVIPAIILGLLFSKKIDEMMQSTTVVALAILLGGIVLIFVDKLFNHPTIDSEKKVSFGNSFVIGIWQCLAMIPGMSRSASSIIGGMQQKLTVVLQQNFPSFSLFQL